MGGLFVGRPLLLDSNDQHRRGKKKVLFLFKHSLLSYLMLYTPGLLQAITTFRENRPILDVEWSTTGSRNVRFRLDGKTVCTHSERNGSPSRTIGFLFWWFYFILRLARDKSKMNFIRLLITFLVSNRGKSRRTPDRINFETHRMSHRFLNQINMAAINV